MFFWDRNGQSIADISHENNIISHVPIVYVDTNKHEAVVSDTHKSHIIECIQTYIQLGLTGVAGAPLGMYSTHAT